MIKTAKYKIFSKNYLPLNSIPSTKILKFHRSKWKKVQKLLLLEDSKITRKNYKNIFKNVGSISCKTKRWDRYQLFYKQVLNLKKQIQNLFGLSTSNNYLKNLSLEPIKNRLPFKSILLIKTEYKIDILLWRLHFYLNVFFSKKAIIKKNIFLNQKKIKSVHFLNCGDILHVSELTFLHFKKTKKLLSFFYTFLEVDYYTNTIIIIKPVTYLTSKDLLLLLNNSYNELDLKEYLLK